MYRWSFSLIVLAFESVILPLVYLLMNEKLRFAANCVNVKIAWGFMWLIPATFSLVWVSYLYAAVEDVSLFRLDAAGLLCLFLINLGAFLVYYIVLLLIREKEKSFSLEEHNHALTLQTLQYAKLTEKIREAEHARHDVRHHVSVLTSHLDKGDYDGLKDYLYEYKQAFHDEDRIDFCAYQPINALLSYFSKQAKDNATKFTVSIRLPKEIGIADNDLSVVIGNLLENAVDACKVQRLGERKIVVGADYDDTTIYFTVDNTFDGEIKKDRHGAFLSTKHSGHGTGTDSVRRIAERYNGIFKTNTKDGVFSASIALRKKALK